MVILYFIILIVFLSLLSFFNLFIFNYFLKNSIFVNFQKIVNNNLLFIIFYIFYKFINFQKFTILNIIYSFYLLILLSIKMINDKIFVYYFDLFNWLDCGLFTCNFGFIFDRITIVMLLVVLFISLIVHIYSIGYISNDPYKNTFFSYLSLFTFFMLLLIVSNNLLQIFLSWEGVSLCSFLLINFWSNRIQANKSSIKAFVINRITDFLLIISFFLIIQSTNSLNLSNIFSIISFYKNDNIFFLFMDFNLIDIISLFLFLGAIGKSAQLFFHTWLPDAMEGPTPVSALIHSATMVTAGIFLVIRFSPIIEYSEFTLKFIVLTGSVTALYSGIVAFFQYDIKKIIAFSTCSQLGYMFVGCGISGYNLSLFHLFNHSFFKAMLFLSSGIIIHYMGENQDIRRFGSLFNVMPLVYIFFLIGGLALIGFPFLTGFYSKEALLDVLFVKDGQLFKFSFWLLVISTFFTSAYVTRLFYLTFYNKTSSYKNIIINIDKKFNSMIFSILLLSLCSIFFGFYFKEIFIGIGSNFFDNSFFILPQHNQKFDYFFSLNFLKLSPLFFNFFSIFIIYLIYNLKIFPKISKYYEFYNFFNRKFFFDKIYNSYIVEFLFYISYNKLYKIYDKKIFNVFGYNGIIKIFDLFGFLLLKLEKNKLTYSISIIYILLLIILFCSNL